MKMHCPYCAREMEDSIRFEPMSKKRKAILDMIIAAGADGVSTHEIKDKIFTPGASSITVRTTILAINKTIKPRRIVSRDGILRLSPLISAGPAD